MSNHITAKKEDIAKVVLMPGDPQRAKFMAEQLLTNFKQVNDLRGILAFTGYTKSNKRITIMASGMGLASIGIYSYELYHDYDVDVIIRIGTCGAYLDSINVGDVVVASTSTTDSSWAKQYGIDSFSPAADIDLLVNSYAAIKRRNLPVHFGSVLSSDVFYDDDPNRWKNYEKLGVLGVEMESYSLYCNANRLNKKALCILTISNHFKNNNELSKEDRITKTQEMVEIAIEAAEPFCD